MKIAHVGLASFYTDGMTYQDNQLAEQNFRDGHQVLYVSNAAKYEGGKIVETGYEDTILPCGVRLVRLPYEHVVNHFVSDKLRKVKGLYKLLEDFAPDVILSHDLCYWSVLDVIRYKKDHPEVKLYADTHTAANNSGTNWLSLHILHRGLYRYLTQRALPYLERYFYISSECEEFSAMHYGVPESIMEFYPLGGVLFSKEEHAANRSRHRAELRVAEDELLLIHSGKLETLKRTEELLRAFAAVPELNAKLAVIGSIPEDRKALLTSLMEADSRVVFLGWKSASELLEYLCAGDVYCQPGAQSATMQNAVCCGCAMMLYPHSSHTKHYEWGNVFWVRTQDDMEAVFHRLARKEVPLEQMKQGSVRCARELLDYRKLAARLYQ